MRAYGLAIENNKSIRFLAALTSPRIGALIGIFIPTLALIALLMWTHFGVGLAYLAGFRSCLAFIQYRSTKLDIPGLALPPSQRSSAQTRVEPTEPRNTSQDTQ